MSRKIDALIAEHVMGFENVHGAGVKCGGPMRGTDPTKGPSFVRVPNYSTDIAAAWEVVEKMKCETGLSMQTSRYGADYVFSFGKVQGVSKSISMAIALAALKSKGVEYESD